MRNGEIQMRQQNIKQMIRTGLKIVSKAEVLVPFRTKMSGKEAYQILQAVQPCPQGTCVAEHSVKEQYDLQIVVPAYNAERYIQACVESVLSQKTTYHCLMVVVNDGSTDRTGNILTKLAEKNANSQIELRIITQENKGLSGARNTGFQTILGRYVTFLDADDLLAPDAIETMLKAADQYQADLLQGSWYLFDQTGETQHILPKQGIQEERQGRLAGFAWGKLYRSCVLSRFQFPEGFWFEDTPIAFMIGMMPYRLALVQDVVYGYRKNPKGISAMTRTKKKAVDSYWITQRCLEEYPAFGLTYDQRAYEFLLRQAVVNASRMIRQPRDVREAAFVLTCQLADRYFQGFHTRKQGQKKLERALRKRQFMRFELLAMRDF